MRGTFLVIFQVFHDFQSLWEPWNNYNLRISSSAVAVQEKENLVQETENKGGIDKVHTGKFV